MNCQAAREWMLEADPAELAVGPEGSLAGHLRQCTECRAAAARLLDGMAVLDRELAVAPARPVEVALARLRHHRRIAPSRVMPWAAAAAAILAAVVVFEPWQGGAPLSEFEPGAGLPSSAPIVEDAGGASVAMFATTNPRITIVWLYEENSP
jgi:predicted anti-sigma-YlaC factor YlaD